ncbi:hypothetical protein CGMCC3_g9622 [Colletotrichum fructicola]|uniref:Uncharacterized protein n=1 Tax=Colletotrichum fructicola (strain Nara gc5) TaxID=1213859 RepID=A0A7J6IDS3_COLFN|nr:uncharacterized protein CGMCC3_g9622 [Colletotrichum fructicola]KAE9574480.1 hypothetical protein CGMCC3_g9622 [Colletotrichum fructicola]KAF4474478.1 hypothetical protein CGGC5_v016700 [Colletotrichum fructicola Nara gc5]
MFGGLVEFYENQRDPLGARQAGVPYLMTNGNPKSPARYLAINYVLDFVNGNYSYPARASSNAPLTTRQALRGSSREVSELRPKGISKAPPTSSPPRGNTPSGSGSVGSSSSAWRRLPFGFSRRSAGRSG